MTQNSGQSGDISDFQAGELRYCAAEVDGTGETSDNSCMELRVLSSEDCEQVRLWRNECLVSLRTSFALTAEQQRDFYTNTVCNRNARARYWGIWFRGLIGMCGLENIEYDNRLAEISIILSPDCRGKGLGFRALDLMLHEGFFKMNLENIWGECYESNPAFEFWKKVCKKYSCYMTMIPNRKYWDGIYYNSLYFNIQRSDFTK